MQDSPEMQVHSLLRRIRSDPSRSREDRRHQAADYLRTHVDEPKETIEESSSLWNGATRNIAALSHPDYRSANPIDNSTDE